MKRVALSNIYGSHMPMRMQMEQFYLARPLRYTFNSYFFCSAKFKINFCRMPGLQSDYSGLKTVLGEDEDFGFADYLNGTL